MAKEVEDIKKAWGECTLDLDQRSPRAKMTVDVSTLPTLQKRPYTLAKKSSDNREGFEKHQCLSSFSLSDLSSEIF